MRLIEKLRKSSTINLFFATIFIIPFQTILLIPFAIESLAVLRDEPLNLFQNNPTILIVFITLPIIYCIILSLFFQPKRLVSPLNIQIGTFVLFSFIVINSSLDATMSLTIIENLFMVLSLIAIIILEIAFFQFIIVWWVVGLNYDDSDRSSFMINGTPKEIVKILGKNFCNTRNFSIKKEDKKTDKPTWILRCRDNFKNIVIIAFGSYEDNNDKCTLATVVFHKNLSWISKSKIASEMRNSILHDIKGRLEKSNPKFTISQLERVDDIVSVKAFSYIESITRSKIEIVIDFFERITPFFRRAIYITLLAFGALTFACYMGFLDVNTYIGVIIPIIIALIIEVGLPLRDELSIKKIDEFN